MSELPPIVGAASSPIVQSPTCSINVSATTLFLQTSQRLGAIALFSTLAGWAVLYLAKDASMPIAITVAASIAGLCAGLIARMLTGRGSSDRREANGVAIFNLVLLVLSLHMMLYTRLDLIRASAAEFFTPAPAPVEAAR